MDITQIVLAVFTLTGIVLPSYLTYLEKTKNRKQALELISLRGQLEKERQEKQEYMLRTAVVERLLDITLLSEIRRAVDYMFEDTKAERFLILIAINGKTDFNLVSVIFEQHKTNHTINAIARYKNIGIDEEYKKMLKRAEAEGIVDLEVAFMKEDSLLRNIYEWEGIKHSIVRHLLREPIDEDNDVLIFSTIATFDEQPFTSREKTVFLTQYSGMITPALKRMIEHNLL